MRLSRGYPLIDRALARIGLQRFSDEDRYVNRIQQIARAAKAAGDCPTCAVAPSGPFAALTNAASPRTHSATSDGDSST